MCFGSEHPTAHDDDTEYATGRTETGLWCIGLTMVLRGQHRDVLVAFSVFPLMLIDVFVVVCVGNVFMSFSRLSKMNHIHIGKYMKPI